MSDLVVRAPQQDGTDFSVSLSSPRTVRVEEVVVTPRHGRGDSDAAATDMAAIDSASTHAQTLTGLNAKQPKMVAFSTEEQDRVHHSLYGAAAPAASPSAASSSPVARICLSVRANDLLSPAWFSEANTLLALFAIDSANSAAKYQLLSQTEFVKDSNSPVFKTQFVLDRSAKGRKQTYMVRVYDVESEIIDEAGYMGLAIFNLEELLVNGRGANGGGFVSVILPLINPTNPAWNEQLETAHATITVSLQIPVESGSPAPAVSQAVHQYTRLINYLAPNILSTNADLTLAVESASAGNLLSVWYRPRPTALFQFLGQQALAGSNHTFVVSNEAFLEECAAGGDIDEIEAGFEVKVLLHDKSKLPINALATARNAERALGASVNSVSSADERAATNKDPALLASASVSFKNLFLALDQVGGLQLILDNGVKVRMSLRTRTGASESGDSSASDDATALTVPSLPASLPPAVLAKAHELIKAGLYFTEYNVASGGLSSGAVRRDVFAQLIDGVAEGAGRPTRLTWKDAAGGAEASIDLSALTHIFGGRDTSDAFSAQTAAGKPLPSNDTLFTINAGARSVSFEASSWQTRDTFIFSVLSFQATCGLPVALWHPSGVELGLAPRIVAQEKPTIATVKPQLGGSHGSLARSPPRASGAASPASPSSGLASDVDLGEVLSKLEKLFEAGRNFIRFTSGSHKPHYISLFLRKDAKPQPNGKTLFALYWCKADQRSVSVSRCLRCEDITGISLGKQTSVFRKDEASLAPASHCFSIICVNKSLHLQSWNERDSDTYSFGIASLIKHYGPKPKLWQAGQYSESLSRLDLENASELQEESDGTAQVEPGDVATLANAQGYKCNIELSIKCKNLPSKHANHIVCVFDRDEQTEKLSYLAQTEKQNRAANPEFRKVFRLTYDSTVLRKLRFNVYDIPPTSKQMDDEDRIGSSMMLLKEVVDGAGIEFVYKLTHENAVKQAALAKLGATVVVQCSSKSEMALDMSTQKA